MENLETKQKFVELRAKGNSFQKIADELGVTKQTLITWSRSLQLEIHNQRSMEYDNLLVNYQLTRENQIRNLGIILKKVNEEIDKRCLEELATDKVFALYFKLFELLKTMPNSIALEEDSTWSLDPPKTTWSA